MLEAEKVKGFDKLTVGSGGIFRAFLQNFYNAWGLETRETIKPISVAPVSKNGESYLRFNYKINGRKTWLHVVGSRTWY